MIDVSHLRPHPRQAELVGDMPAADFVAFAADIRAHGINTALIVMGDGQTLVCGHQRLRAAKEHGFKRVPCVVRNDLTDPENPEVIELLLGDNLHRRHFSKLQQAKGAMQLIEIECDRRNVKNEWQRKRLIEDAVAAKLGGGGKEADLKKGRKNAQRYVSVAKAPDSIQAAFERGVLTLTTAARIARLEPVALKSLEHAISELLKSTDDAEVRRKIRDALQAGLSKADWKNSWSRRRTLAKPSSSPMDVLRKLVDDIDEGRRGLDEKADAIVRSVKDEIAPLKPLRAAPIFDAMSRCEDLLQRLGEIRAAFTCVPFCERGDDEVEDAASGTSCPFNDAIVVAAV
jgi:ParB-like chromosome segregation protein Spo0J